MKAKRIGACSFFSPDWKSCWKRADCKSAEKLLKVLDVSCVLLEVAFLQPTQKRMVLIVFTDVRNDEVKLALIGPMSDSELFFFGAVVSNQRSLSFNYL